MENETIRKLSWPDYFDSFSNVVLSSFPAETITDEHGGIIGVKPFLRTCEQYNIFAEKQNDNA